MDQVRENKERLFYIDLIRILACLTVIYNHTNENGFYHYMSESVESPIWMWDTLLAIICKVGVPLFYMISGAMLFGKSESIRQTYKRIPRIAVDLIIFSLLSMCLDSVHWHERIDVADMLIRTLTESYRHLWFLYSYIAFIVALPILRCIDFNRLTNKLCIYLFIVSFIILCVKPIVSQFVIAVNPELFPSWLTGYTVIYPIMGYIINDRINIQHRRFVVGGCILCIILLVFNVFIEKMYIADYPQNISDETFLRVFVFVYASVIFADVKILFGGDHNERLGIVIHEMGKCTFGVYLIHFILLRLWFYKFKGIFGNHPGVLISCIIVYAFSTVLVFAARRIPVVKKLL